jgi:glycosyltransferase involved in cell wall biosynthesis
VVLEAMASGLPVIAVPAGGVADHLRNDENGIAVPAHDVDAMARAIVALTLDAIRRRRLSVDARRTACALDWNTELDRLDAIYREVIGWNEKSGQHSRGGSGIFDDSAANSAAS